MAVGCPHFRFFQKSGQKNVRISDSSQKADRRRNDGCGIKRKEGALRRCRVHGYARTDAAMRPQADEGRKKRAWRLPTLPHRCSTIGVRALDFRVRDGNGYYHSAMATKPTQTWEPEWSDAWSGCSGLNAGTRWTIWSSRSDD